MSRRGGVGLFGGNAGMPGLDEAGRLALTQRVELEVRRDYLRWVFSEFGLPTSVQLASTITGNDRVQAEITQLEAVLRIDQEGGALSPRARLALAPKVFLDAEGIRRSLGKQFAQMFAAPDVAAEGAPVTPPFVYLSLERGLSFYFTTPEEATAFAAALAGSGVSGVRPVARSLTDGEIAGVPASDQSAVRTAFGSVSGACTVDIPHQSVERVVRLAQYHPYRLSMVLDDLYRAAGLDYAVCLARSLCAAGSRAPARGGAVAVAESLPVQLSSVSRVPLPGTEDDLVAVTVRGRSAVAAAVSDLAREPAHVVVVLDDSSSMDVQKMTAANHALKALVRRLPSGTLVTIQPLNTRTVAYRIPVEQIWAMQDAEATRLYFSTKATGGTPLVQALASSAALVRPDPDDLIISENVRNRTIIVALTDGQDNGGGHSGTGDAAVVQMRTGAAGPLLPAVDLKKLRGFAPEYTGTVDPVRPGFGFPGLPCGDLPPVLPIAIGTDADTTMLREISQSLGVPRAFVSDGPGRWSSRGEGTRAAAAVDSIETSMIHAVGLAVQMIRRVPQVFIGVAGSAAGVPVARGVAERNVFDGTQRTVFMRVPRSTQSLQVAVAVSADRSTVEAVTPQRPRSDEAQALIASYVAEQLMQIRQDYAAKVSLLKGRPGAQGQATGRFAAPVPAAPAPGDAEKTRQFQALQAATADQLAELQAMLGLTSPQHAQIGQVLAAVRADALEQPADARILPTPEQVAAFTQGRHLTPAAPLVLPMPSVPGQPPAPRSVFDCIWNDDFTAAQRMVDSVDVGLGVRDPRGATPLISAVCRWEALQKQADSPARAAALTACSDWMTFLISHYTEADLCAQDGTGNTAAHRAIWYGNLAVTTAILKKAGELGCLPRLRGLRNQNRVGATQGETLWDNARMSPAYSPVGRLSVPGRRSDMLASVHRALYQDMAGHIPAGEGNPHRDSTLMLAIRREEYPVINPPVTQAARSLEFGFSNLAGDTALHLALQRGALSVARTLLDSAVQDGVAAPMLRARNSVGLTHTRAADGIHVAGGQVPHMVAAALGCRLIREFDAAYNVIASDISGVAGRAGLNPAEMARMSFEAVLEAVVRSGVDDGTRTSYLHALTAFKRMREWQAFSNMMVHHLDAQQHAEYNHLLTVYGKYLDGYNAENWLKAAPLHRMRTQVVACHEFLATRPLETDKSNDQDCLFVAQLIKDLDAALEERDSDQLIVKLDALQRTLTQMREAGLAADSAGFAGSAMGQLLNGAVETLTQYRAYAKAELDRLREQASMVPPPPAVVVLPPHHPPARPVPPPPAVVILPQPRPPAERPVPPPHESGFFKRLAIAFGEVLQGIGLRRLGQWFINWGTDRPGTVATGSAAGARSGHHNSHTRRRSGGGSASHTHDLTPRPAPLLHSQRVRNTSGSGTEVTDIALGVPVIEDPERTLRRDSHQPS